MVHHDAEHQTYLTTSYGPAPQRVLVVDGCFIALMNKGLEAFRSGSLKFNEKFNFDFYDVALCMDAFKLGLNVGVEAILPTHDSIGKGALKPSFLEA